MILSGGMRTMLHQRQPPKRNPATIYIRVLAALSGASTVSGHEIDGAHLARAHRDVRLHRAVTPYMAGLT
jgi:hypothetical protein